MVKNKIKSTTLDDLVNMVAKRFEGVDKRFESADKRFDKIEHELGDVKQRLGKIEYHVDEAHDILKRFEETDILNLQKRVQILEKVVRSLSTQIQK